MVAKVQMEWLIRLIMESLLFSARKLAGKFGLTAGGQFNDYDAPDLAVDRAGHYHSDRGRRGRYSESLRTSITGSLHGGNCLAMISDWFFANALDVLAENVFIYADHEMSAIAAGFGGTVRQDQVAIIQVGPYLSPAFFDNDWSLWIEPRGSVRLKHNNLLIRCWQKPVQRCGVRCSEGWV